MRRLVVGDIHGGFRALEQVLQRAEFNKDEDMLLSVGDYVDGWPQSYEVVEFLSSLPNFRGVRGNHDQWFLDFLSGGWLDNGWVRQGGRATLESYRDIDAVTRNRHMRFLQSLPSYLILDNTLICHGGTWSPSDLINVKNLRDEEIQWDRNLYQMFAIEYLTELSTGKSGELDTSPFDRVIIGHTTTTSLLSDMRPFTYKNLWNIDQGGGWEGKLTVLDFDSEDYWQSDVVGSLYEGVRGRR